MELIWLLPLFFLPFFVSIRLVLMNQNAHLAVGDVLPKTGDKKRKIIVGMSVGAGALIFAVGLGFGINTILEYAAVPNKALLLSHLITGVVLITASLFLGFVFLTKYRFSFPITRALIVAFLATLTTITVGALVVYGITWIFNMLVNPAVTFFLFLLVFLVPLILLGLILHLLFRF